MLILALLSLMYAGREVAEAVKEVEVEEVTEVGEEEEVGEEVPGEATLCR